MSPHVSGATGFQHDHDANDPKWKAVEKSIPSRQSKSSDAEAVDLDAMQADRTQPSTSAENPLRNSDNFEPSPEVSVGMEEQVEDPSAGPDVIEANGMETNGMQSLKT